MPARRAAILVVGLILSIHPHLSAQVRNVQSAGTFSTSSASSIAQSFTVNTTASDTVIVGVSTAGPPGPAITSVVDTQGNTYAQAVALNGVAIWYAKNIAGGADRVTATFASSTAFSVIYIHEYAGLDTSAPLDQFSSQSGSGTAVTSGAKTTTSANELIFGYAGVNDYVSAAGSGFVARQSTGGNMSEDEVVSATGSYAATFTQNNNNGNLGWVGLMATFKAASGANPTIHNVQSAGTFSTSSASSIAQSFTVNTTASDTVIVGVSTAGPPGPAITSVVDTQGNTYAQAVALNGVAIWYAKNIAGGADRVTATFASSTAFSVIYIHEYAGLDTSAPLDQFSSQSGSGTAVTSGAKTTTSANELIFGYAGVNDYVSAAGSGFVARQSTGGNMSEDEVVSATGSYAATFTQNNNNGNLGWVGLMATFKAASGGPPPTLKSISVTPANPTITVGGTPLQLTATGTYSDSSMQNVTTSCAWTSNATGVATVSSSGQVTGVTTGSAKITCTVGSINGSTTVTVTVGAVGIHYVQSANSVSFQSATGISASFSANTTPGDAVIVSVSALTTSSTSGPAITSVVDTQGNAYVQAVSLYGNAVWYAANIRGGADTITANFAASAAFSLVYIHEYAGLQTSAPLDQVSSQTGTGTSVTSGAKTTTSANELIFGFASVDYFVSASGPGFTMRQNAGGNMSEDKIVSATGSYAATFTQNNHNGTMGWVGLVATFIAATGGGGGGTPPTAVISANPTSGTAALTVAFSGTGSTDPDGTITSYAWNFGDGQTSSAVSPSHSYAVVGTYTVGLTVTDNAGRQGSTSTAIAVSAPASNAGVYRIIAGGGPYRDSQGQVWQGDAGYNTGDTSTTTATISGTSDPALYQSERWDDPSEPQLEYQLPVANGTYLVNLYFAETDAASKGTGLRVFGVNFQGTPVIENLDIYGTVGANAALVKSAVVGVTNGMLTIDFVRAVGNPKIDAIEVREVSGRDNELPKMGWKVPSVDSEEWDTLNGSALNAIDNNGSSFWITQTTPNGNLQTPPGYPHFIQVDLGKSYPLSGLQELPRQDGSAVGWIAQYNVSVSSDGVNWGSPVASGTFAASALQQQVSFAPVNARYVQLEALSEVLGRTSASMAELGILFQCATTPSVVITAPVDDYLQSSGASLTATAHACLNPVQNAGWGVQFKLDGANPINVFTPPYQATYTGLSKAEHVIDAYVINSTGGVVTGTGTHDQVKEIGIGDYYVTMGDSVTWGAGGTIATSSDGRDTGSGYEPLLNNQLTPFKVYPQEVADEGVPGTTSAEGLVYLPAILNKHPGSQTFLVMFGMNDARPWLPVPSGEGLNPGDSGYAGSYKDNMQQLINQLNAAGKHVDLAKTNVALADCADNNPSDSGYCPPYPNLNTGARNVLIQQYNVVVDELVSNTVNGITVTPPDFYSYFSANHQGQYFDNIHPNAIGYQSMANLWFQALTH